MALDEHTPEYTSIELFTGGGGLALGTHRAGFHHLAVVELERNSCNTLVLNSTRRVDGIHWHVAQVDVADFDYGRYPIGIDLLAGGAPCQPFSLGGKHAGEADRRNLFPYVFDAVRRLRPKAVLLENVKGLTRQSFAPYFNYILLQLRFPRVTLLPDETWESHKERLLVAAGADHHADADCYDVQMRVVDVADYGIPQRRHRVFIVGFRKDLDIQWEFPEPTHSQDSLLYAQYVDGSYWDQHDLVQRPAPPHLEKRVAQLATIPRPSENRWLTVRDAINDLPVPVDRQPHADYDNHIGIPDARVYPGHTGSPWDWPAKTIKAGAHGNPGGENMLVDDDGSVRYFTVRELARLQTFPDSWHFAGSWGESRRQLGNAVPVRMAEILGHSIARRLSTIKESQSHSPNLNLVAAPD